PEPRVTSLAEDDLLGALVDITQTQAGRFHWSEDPDRGEDEWVPLELSLRHVLFESLRFIDEMPDVERAVPSDTLVVTPIEAAAPNRTLQRLLVSLAQAHTGMTTGRLWLMLGLTRTVVTRAIFELVRTAHLTLEGAPAPEADPIADMLEKGA